ncbi:MAG: flippase-like domain-containing protein [Microthrixaceae bacterium]
MTAVDERPAPEPEDDLSPAVQIDEPEGLSYERSPADVMRAAIALLTLGVAVLLAKALNDTMAGFASDLLGFWNQLPDWITRFLYVFFGLFALIFPIGLFITLLAQRRFRVFGLMAAAGALAQLAAWGLAEALGTITDPNKVKPVDFAGLQVSVAVDASAVAAAAASATVLRAYLGRRWGRVLWGLVVLYCGFRVIAGTDPPLDLFVPVAVGWLIGLLVLLAAGTPDLRPHGPDVVTAMDAAGFPLRTLSRAGVDARGSTPWFATAADGEALFVKTLGRDERSSDLMFRVIRWFTLKDVGDERPFSSLRRAVEHEAFIALKARDGGVRTPRLRSVATVGEDGMLLAYEAIGGKSLDGQPDEALTDEVLDRIWGQVKLLRDQRIAHRDLRLANVFLDDDGQAWMIDFGFSELAVTDARLAQDVAQLIVSSARKVGAERAVAAAIRGIGPEAVGECQRFLQPLALAGATRAAIKADKNLLPSVREQVQDQCAIEELVTEPLARFNIRTLLMLVAGGIAIYVLIPQLADVAGMFRQLKDANWGLLGISLIFSFVTYIGAALSISGAAPIRLPLRETFLAQMAGSFTNRITPAGVGGMAVQVRYLTQVGADTTQSVAALGINSFAGFVCHMVVTLVFVVWAGDSGTGFSLPSAQLIFIVLAVVGVASGVVLLTPWGRKHVLNKVVATLSKAWDGLRTVATKPTKLVTLFAGGTLVPLAYLASLVAAIRAFGGDTSVATIGVVYLIGAAVAGAAPTPGGLGAVEAALIAGLTASGLSNEIAVPGVLAFRLATFWIPILPGWLSFNFLTSRKLI